MASEQTRKRFVTILAFVVLLLVFLYWRSSASNDGGSGASLPTADATETAASPDDGATTTLVIGTYNVESGEADALTVGERIADVQGVDMWALTEVSNDRDAATLEIAAEEGEAADFVRIVGSSGGSDRVVILYDGDRFTKRGQGELYDVNIGGRVRAPLFVHLQGNESGLEFIFMANHLYSSDNEARHLQSTMLNQWAAAHSLPIIAAGDYNYRWHAEFGESDHDRGYDNLTENNVWTWVRPQTLVRTQCEVLPDDTCRYNSVLDFIFVANDAQNWPARTEILVVDGDFPDDDLTSDHRPVLAWFQVEGR